MLTKVYKYLCANYFEKCATKWFRNTNATGQSFIASNQGPSYSIYVTEQVS